MIIEIGENLAQILVMLGFIYLLKSLIYAWVYREGVREDEKEE